MTLTQTSMITNLQEMQLPCSTSRIPLTPTKWTNTTKVDRAAELAELAGYNVTKGNCSYLFSKVPVDSLKDWNHIILISSHADFVPAITKPFCDVTSDGKTLRGTFDNSITNATIINMMQEGLVPDNVIFALTGDEETGKCRGAKEIIQMLLSFGVNMEDIYPIALDVTYEGYRKLANVPPFAFTVENVSTPETLELATNLCTNKFSYLFVPSFQGYFPRNYEGYLSKSYSLFDEGVAYQSILGKGFSFCIPCSGHMHSNTGVSVKTETYLNYNEALTNYVLQYERYLEEAAMQKENRLGR